MLAISFSPKVDYAQGGAQVVSADLNHDGIPDLVTANSNTGNVDVRFGQGGGQFGAVTSYAVGGQPYDLKTADFNGDGNLDAAVVNYNSHQLAVLRGNANGLFQSPTYYGIPFNPSGVDLGDMNNDGKLDIIVNDFNGGTGAVRVLLGNGDATFQSDISISRSEGPHRLALADLNGDQKLDVVTANYYHNSFSLLLGNGAGGLASGGSFSAGLNPTGIAVADLNRDGLLDVIVANSAEQSGGGGGSVTVHRGLGNGAFASAISLPTGAQTISVIAADLNGDGHLDLAATLRTQVSQVAVWLGHGDLTFESRVSFATAASPYALTAADLDGNGTLDLGVSAGTSNTSVLLNAAAPANPHLSISVSTNSPLNLTSNVTVAARDGANNVLTGFTGTVHFASSDPLATLPADYAFQPADGGTKTFSITLRAGGTQTICATLVGSSGIFAGALANSLQPTVWWRAEGNANDSIDGNSGTFQAGNSFAAGQLGQAFSFNGSNAVNIAKSNSVLNPGSGNFTIEGWIQASPTQTTPDYKNFLMNYGGVQYYSIGLNPENRLIFNARDANSTAAIVIGATPLNDGQWHHVAATRSGAVFSIYVDGQLAGTQTNGALGAINPSTSYARIGGTYTSTNHETTPASNQSFFVGKIDELAYFQRALTSTEIQALAGDVNHSPAAVAGGPYSVKLGSYITLDASGTFDPEEPAANLRYEWDLNGDGAYNEATGIKPTYFPKWVDGPKTLAIGVKVTDANGASSTTSTILDVLATDPTKPATVPTSADTLITDGALGSPSSTHGQDTNLWSINFFTPGGGGSLATRPMFQFDLTPYAGATLTGDATFRAYLNGPSDNSSYWHGDSRRVDLYRITSPWDAATVSWNTRPSISFLQSKFVVYNGPGNNGYVDWTVPQSVVQGWINSPATNLGLMIVNELPDAFFYDLIFASRENAVNKPALLELLPAVIQSNKPPTLDAIGNPQPILEDAGQQVVSLSGITTGGESQQLTVTASSSNPGLIPNPTVTYSSPNATGSLAFAPVANKSGSAVITVTVRDDGGTANGGVDTISRTFTVTVDPVNDEPSFTAPAPRPVDVSSSLVTVPGWASFNPGGGTDEAAQTATYHVTNVADLAGILNGSPTVSANGTLTYALAGNKIGSATFDVFVQDSGGMANGGHDTSVTKCFTIRTATTGQANVATSADTYISDNGAGSPTSTHGQDPSLWSIKAFTPPFGSSLATRPMFQFDLSAYSGVALTEDARFRAYLVGPHNPDYFHSESRLVELHKLTGGWNADTVSWSSRPGSQALSSISIQYLGPQNDGYVEWTLPKELVQGWIDGTVANYGLMIVNALPDAFFYDLVFASRENPLNKPAELVITAVGIAPSNHAPLLDATKSPVLAEVIEDAGGPSGTVGTLVSSLVDLATPAGQFDNVTDADSGALLGIALTAADTSSGTWFYSTSNGANWTTVGVISDAGSLLLAADAATRLYFQPSASFNGAVSAGITFRAWDQTSGANGTTASTTANGGATAYSAATDSASITVTQVNDPGSFGGNKTGSGAEDAGPITGTLTFGDAADGYAAGNFVVSGSAAHGTASIAAASGVWSYSPSLDFNGDDSFVVSVTDDDGNVEMQVIAITVTQVNDWPTLNPIADPGVIQQDSGLQTVGLAGISAGGGESQTLTVFATSSDILRIPDPVVSYTSPAATGSLSYAPVPGAWGTAQISVTVKDDGGTAVGGADTITRTFQVRINARPSINSISVPGSVEEGSSVTLSAAASDSDGPSSLLSYSWTVLLGGQPYTTGAGASFSFTPGDDGTFGATLTVRDADGGIATTSRQIQVRNVKPVITIAEGSGQIDAAGNFAASGSFTDPGQDQWTGSVDYGDGTVAPLAIMPDQTFVLSHQYTFTQPQAFRVRVTIADDDGGSDTHQGNKLIVTGTLGPDQIRIKYGSVIVEVNGQVVTHLDDVTSIVVLGGAGDDDLAVDSLLTQSVELLGGAGNDVLAGGSGVNVLSGGDGDDEFRDGGGINSIIGGRGDNRFVAGGGVNTFLTQPGSLTPEVFADAYVLSEDTTLVVPAYGILANDIDPLGRVLQAALVTAPAHGHVELHDDGSFVYVPDPDFNGDDTFAYQADAGGEISSVASVRLSVAAVNDAPQGADRTVTTAEDAAYILSAADFGFSDVDAADSLVAVRIETLPASGRLTLAGATVSPVMPGQVIAASDLAAGKLVYTPPAIASGALSASCTFSVRDAGGLFDSTPNTLTIASMQHSGVTIGGGILRFGGGSGADNVSVSGGSLVVNGVLHSLAGISEIRIWARGGDDTIDLTGLAVKSFIDGGQGNDLLTGGSADDVIFGGLGNDTITGAAGNDFLIGGAGKDRIVGSNGHDILASSDVADFLDLVALRAISQAWAGSHSADATSADDYLDETVANGDNDLLTGSSGADLFLINSGDKITDFSFANPNANKDGDVVIKDGQTIS